MAALALSACAVAPRAIETLPSRPLRAATLDEVRAAYDAYARGAQSLSASGDLEVRDRRRGQARRFGMRLLAGREGQLYIKASVAVVTALEVVADGREFWFQVPSKKTVWTGRADARPALGATREPYEALRPADILAALLPAPLDPAPGEALVLESDREGFSLLVARSGAGPGSARRRVWLERESLQPSRLRSYDPAGEVELDVALADWREGQPRRVELSRPQDGYEARFDFDKLRTNVPLPPAAFAPRTPSGYEVVRVE